MTRYAPGSPVDADRIWRMADARIDPEHGAVFTRGRLRIEAALQRHNGYHRGWRGTVPPDPRRLAGRHLYGGTLFFHFGHFLTESLSRLWAVADSGAQSILFTPKSLRGRQPPGLTGWQTEILDRLGVRLPVRIVYEPVEVEDLLVPAQGFGLGPMSHGTPAFRAFARRMRPPDADRVMHDGAKVYLSRSRLPRRAGSILGEARLEQALADEGFAIFHPQDHSIDEQVRVLSTARHLLGPEGSAFHLTGLVVAPWQSVALIRRRSTPDIANIADHVRGMGASVRIVDILAAEWLRPGKDRSDDMSWGEPDLAVLSDRLLALGLITRPLRLNAADHAAELDLIRQAHKGRALRRVAWPHRVPHDSVSAARRASGREDLSPGPQER